VPRNHRLEDAIRQRGWNIQEFAQAVEVDPKTVTRWVTTGRLPHPRLRQSAADSLGVPAGVLWPGAVAAPNGAAELVGVYKTRTEVSPATIQSLLAGATQNVNVLAYAGLWLWDAVPNFADLLVEKLAGGVEVRVCLGEPASDAVLRRGDEEGIGSNLAARCRIAIAYSQPLAEVRPSAVRCSDATLYASILRFDEDLLVNVHLWGNPAAASPVLHFRRDDDLGIAANVIQSFDRVWEAAQPVLG
jgi:hypothetical protein